MKNKLKIGYLGHSGWSSWAARYALLDGTIKQDIKPNGQSDRLHIAIETSNGALSIKIKDENGAVVFDEENIQKSISYDVNVAGKVTLFINANNHKGSFCINYADS